MPYRTNFADPPPTGLVVLDHYLDTIGAEVARARLAAEGIHAFVNEANSVNPLWNVAAGGTTLSVAARDEADAREILEALHRENAADEPDDEAERRCPRCESEYCFYERTARSLGKKCWRCRKCEHEWDDDETGRRVRRTALVADIRPVFRLRRGSAGMGLFFGFLLGALGGATVGGGGGFILLALSVLGGYVIGGARRHDVCSEPSCRAPLTAELETCPRCRGVLAGVISAAAEHHSASAEIRRELADETRPKRKKKKRKPPSPQLTE